MANMAAKKIIVIGAGLAGLAACKHLAESGFDAVILEARDRCGGRIWSNPLGIMTPAI
jgi:monoamine oxidase